MKKAGKRSSGVSGSSIGGTSGTIVGSGGGSRGGSPSSSISSFLLVVAAGAVENICQIYYDDRPTRVLGTYCGGREPSILHIGVARSLIAPGSVCMWDGIQLSKVGEGLGNSALSMGMRITTAALAGPNSGLEW